MKQHASERVAATEGPSTGRRARLHEIIFEADTRAALMYVVEGEEHGFTSIPISIYWAIVTLTTVGYGDLSPRTPFGQILASIVMVIGYGIIAVPTGIVTVELAQAARQRKIIRQSCPSCGTEGHDPDAVFCKYCGASL